jgi:hypothetical protein
VAKRSPKKSKQKLYGVRVGDVPLYGLAAKVAGPEEEIRVHMVYVHALTRETVVFVEPVCDTLKRAMPLLGWKPQCRVVLALPTSGSGL